MKKLFDTLAAMPSELYLIFVLAVVMMLGLCNLAHGQYSNCYKPKRFIAEARFDASQTSLIPTGSFSLGITGTHPSTSPWANASGMIGVRWLYSPKSDKNPVEQSYIVPFGTLLYRFNTSADSRVVHAIAISSSLGSVKYTGVEYRFYQPTNEYSFATIGGIIGWNSFSGFSIGFTGIGFF